MNLSEVTIEAIFSLVSPSDLSHSLCVCKQWKEWLEGGKLSDRIWAHVTDRMFGGPAKSNKISSPKIQLKALLGEFKKVSQQPVSTRLQWAISSGHGNYAAKVWNTEMKGKTLPDAKKVISQALTKGHFTVVEWCAEVLNSESEKGFEWNQVLISAAKKNAPISFISRIADKYNVSLDKQDAAESLLSIAISNNKIPLIEFLLSRNVSIIKISHDLSAFHVAVNHGNVEIFEMLKNYCLNNGGNENFMENINRLVATKRGILTPLFLSAVKNNTDSMKWLLDNGADYSIPDSFGEYPIHLTELKLDSLLLLLDAGENIHRICQNKYSDPVQLLHIAAMHRKMDIIDELFRRDNNYSNYEEGCAPAVFYAFSDCKMINKLLSMGASPLTTHDGMKTSEALDYLDYLKSSGVSSDAKTDANVTPLLYHIHGTANLDIIKWFVEKGNADVNSIGANGMTPFLSACDNKCSDEIIDYLTSKGANVHAMNDQGENGVFLAVRFLSAGNLLSKLFSLGVKHISNNVGEWPFMLAVEMGSLENVKVLVEEGKADIHQKNRQQHDDTALAVARSGDYNELAEYLETKLN